ncbi:MAG TPA: MFS transporter [Planctomycetota bacterium]
MRPSRARYGVILFAVVLAIIQYVDRICISKGMKLIDADLNLGPDAIGWIYGAFTLSYSLFEIPTGWMGDRFGAKKTLIRVTLWWSLFTAATGWVKGFWSLWIVRFLFGAGEAGCFPNITKAFSTWLPPSEKVRAQSVLWLAARWGGAFTPLLVYWVLDHVPSWRHAFYIFGGLGVVWVVAFAWWFKDNPHEHPGVNEEEKKLLTDVGNLASQHEAVPWKVFASSRSAWLLWAQYFLLSYSWYFYITWFPGYFDAKYAATLGPKTCALLEGLPLFLGGFGSLFSGFVVQALSRKLGDLGAARRTLARVGFGGAGVCVLLAYYSGNPWAMALLLGCAGLFNDFVMPSAWGACMDVGGKFAGTFSGSMNMLGNFGGFFASVIIGYIIKHTGNKAAGDFPLIFYFSAASYFLGVLCWKFIDPVTPLEREAKVAAATA